MAMNSAWKAVDILMTGVLNSQSDIVALGEIESRNHVVCTAHIDRIACIITQLTGLGGVCERGTSLVMVPW